MDPETLSESQVISPQSDRPASPKPQPDEIHEFDLSDQDESESDDDQQREKPIHEELTDMISKVRDGAVTWKDRGNIMKFFSTERWPHLHDKSEVKGRNLLHLLVLEQELPKDTSKWRTNAVQAVAHIWGGLMSQRNDDGRTPLYLAIEEAKYSLVKVMLLGDNKSKIADALDVTCVDGQNCLHLALRSRTIPARILSPLISHARRSTINHRDKDQWTPLHLAVNYTESSEARLRLILELMEKGDFSEDDGESGDAFSAFDVFAGQHQVSVYGHHLSTREKAREKARAIQAKKSSNSKDKPSPTDAASADRDAQKSRQTKRADEKRGGGAPGKLEPERPHLQRILSSVPAIQVDRRNENREAMPREEPKHNDGQADPGDKIGPVRRPTGTFGQGTLLGDNLSQKAPLERVKTEAESPVHVYEKWSEKIRTELKLHCMRRRSLQQTTRFLYANSSIGDNVQLYFDCSQLPVEIDPNKFEKNFRNFKFDEVLQYVDFTRPQGAWGRLSKVPRMSAFTQEHGDFWQSRTNGRKDLLYFFNWLYRKGVRHIIQLNVEESNENLHCDEAIEKSLKPFKIDNLNWSKPDLDPYMLCKACPDVKVLHLHWSGNNAVLRAWSEVGGLRRLEQLSKVLINIDHTLETASRMQMCLDAFTTRLNNPMTREEIILPEAKDSSLRNVTGTSITVTSPSTDEHFDEQRPPKRALTNGVPKTSETKPEKERSQKASGTKSNQRHIKVQFPQYPSHGRPTLARGDGVPSATAEPTAATVTPIQIANYTHRWLDSIDEFAAEMRDLWSHLVEEQKGNALEEVVVGLIDDGVDVCGHSIFDGKILDGRTFGYSQGGEKAKPWYVSETQHGTVMADMILRVCPMAKIFPIRLDTAKQKSRGSISIIPQSGPEAIEAAIKAEVDIISMSWTVDPPQKHTDLKTRFDEALSLADQQQILMFCSSSDGGHYSDEHYPTNYNEKLFFKIGAAKADGHAYEWVAPPEKLDYLFPGVEVLQQRAGRGPAKDVVENWQAYTGSSISTALAAGLAALIISLVKIGARYWAEEAIGSTKTATRFLEATDWKDLQKRGNMMDAFGKCSVLKTEGYSFLEIWKKFDATTKKLRRLHGKENVRARKEIIANFARNFIDKT